MPGPDGSLIKDIQRLGLPTALFKTNTALGGFMQTVSLACRLLDSFNPRDEMQTRDKKHDLTLRQNFSWVLNGYHRLKKIILGWLQTNGPYLTPEDEIVSLQYLTYLHRCCVPDSTLADPLSDMSLTSTWSQCLCGFLCLKNIGRLPSVQAHLGRYLDDLTQAAKTSQSLVQHLSDTVLATLVEVESCGSNAQSLESGLLVIPPPYHHTWVIELILKQSSLRALHAQLLDKAPLLTVASIQRSLEGISEQSNWTLRRVGLSHPPELNEDARPPKRLCLSITPAASTSHSLIDTLMRKISTILRSDCGGTIADLCGPIQ
jgi:serine/threonine-protein kinase ATR